MINFLRKLLGCSEPIQAPEIPLTPADSGKYPQYRIVTDWERDWYKAESKSGPYSRWIYIPGTLGQTPERVEEHLRCQLSWVKDIVVKQVEI